MSAAEREQIRFLCEQIQKEKDPVLFSQLVYKLNGLLERQDLAQLQAPQSDSSNGRSLSEINPYLWLRDSSCIRELLGATIAATAADFGDVQLFDPSHGALRIVAHEGFNRDFLEYFETVDCGAHCSCGAAMKRKSRIVVSDVGADSIFIGGSKEMLLHSHVRSVQSTPLVDPSGRFVGMVSTHYRHVDGPQPEMWPQVDHIVALFMSRPGLLA